MHVRIELLKVAPQCTDIVILMFLGCISVLEKKNAKLAAKKGCSGYRFRAGGKQTGGDRAKTPVVLIDQQNKKKKKAIRLPTPVPRSCPIRFVCCVAASALHCCPFASLSSSSASSVVVAACLIFFPSFTSPPFLHLLLPLSSPFHYLQGLTLYSSPSQTAAVVLAFCH